jgi:hypothetical protein
LYSALTDSPTLRAPHTRTMQLLRTQSGVAGSSRACARASRPRRMRVAAEATKQKAPPSTTPSSSSSGLQQTLSDLGGLGDALGPIGLSYSASAKVCMLEPPTSSRLPGCRASSWKQHHVGNTTLANLYIPFTHPLAALCRSAPPPATGVRGRPAPLPPRASPA